ncbi:MAG: hypothetical protein H0V78_13085 [Burkholderiales bacterium]|nr:hypothetical protein [Burkholderiales bacterium]
MIPWFWYLAPQLHFPFSGSVTQDVSPATNWFFGSIPPEAGNGAIERDIFEIASYGRQLGLILEVLLPLAGEPAVDANKARVSLARLKDIHEKIEKVKDDNRHRTAEAAIELLGKLKEIDPDEFKRVLSRFA